MLLLKSVEYLSLSKKKKQFKNMHMACCSFTTEHGVAIAAFVYCNVIQLGPDEKCFKFY